MGARVSCPDFPARGLRLSLPQLLKAYWSPSQGTVSHIVSHPRSGLSFRDSLQSNDRSICVWEWEDQERCIKLGSSQLGATETFLVSTLYFSISLGCVLLPAFSHRIYSPEPCMQIPTSEPISQRTQPKRWRKFLPDFSHTAFIFNFLLWKYANIHKSHEKTITHQTYKHLAILVSSNPFLKLRSCQINNFTYKYFSTYLTYKSFLKAITTQLLEHIKLTIIP